MSEREFDSGLVSGDILVCFDAFVKLGASVRVCPGGNHWIIKKGRLRLDYWPTTGRHRVFPDGPTLCGFDRAIKIVDNAR